MNPRVPKISAKLPHYINAIRDNSLNLRDTF